LWRSVGKECEGVVVVVMTTASRALPFGTRTLSMDARKSSFGCARLLIETSGVTRSQFV
jgi:hypothetical protein